MSKAFTRESDDLPATPVRTTIQPALPPGARNYLTQEGAERLQKELVELSTVERPRLAARADAITLLRQVDERIRYLQEGLQGAEIIHPDDMPSDRVRFGKTILVRTGDGRETEYRIVGVAESDVERGRISWISPLAKALLQARPGERVRCELPAGEEEFEIVAIR